MLELYDLHVHTLRSHVETIWRCIFVICDGCDLAPNEATLQCNFYSGSEFPSSLSADLELCSGVESGPWMVRPLLAPSICLLTHQLPAMSDGTPTPFFEGQFPIWATAPVV